MDFQVLGKRFTGQQLHSEEDRDVFTAVRGQLGMLRQIVNPAHIGMRDASSGLDLVLEQLQHALVRGDIRADGL